MGKTIIFDMDGVLIDSERMLQKAWRMCAEQLEMKDIDQTIYDCTGLNRADTRVYLEKKYGEAFDYERFQTTCDGIRKKLLEKEKILEKPGVKEILTYLKQAGYRIGLASSSRKVNVMYQMQEIQAMEYFEKIITGDMVAHSKPDPEIYQIACREMGVEPQEAIAVEDSANGIRSACAAGMKVVMIPDLTEPTEELWPMIWKKFDTLTDLKRYLEEKPDETEVGNPRKPQGKAGEDMLKRMNQSHFEMTGWALGFLDIAKDDQFLDIGCGGGATLKRMADKITEGHLYGVDYSEVSVEASKRENEENIQRGKMDVLKASVEALPFPKETFNKIVTVESFYFWPKPQENLKEVHRVLKKDGVFLLIADIYEKEELSEQVKENIRKYQLFNPTIEEFQEMFQKAGFEQITVHTREGKDWICVEGKRG